MSERWFRWYDGTVRDGKMIVAANLCELPVCTVVGVWASILEDASVSQPRGLATKGVKYHSMFLGIAEHEIEAVLAALQQVEILTKMNDGRIVVHNWDKRQYATDAKDPTAKSRKDKWKQEHKEAERSGTARNDKERSGTPDTETETDTETDKDISSLREDGWPNDYRERFYNAYPRKVGRKAVYRKLEQIRRSGEITFERLIAAISTIDVTEQKFIPLPMTWLNQGRYLDAGAEPIRIVDDDEFIRLKSAYDEKVARTA